MVRQDRQPTSRAAADAAAVAIYERRRRVGDPDLEKLGDDADGLLAYAYERRSVDVDVLQADAVAGLQIVDHLRAELRRETTRGERRLDHHELELLRSAQAAGMTLTQLAGRLGMASRQAVEAKIRRLESAVNGGPKGERAGRKVREVTQAKARQQNRRDRWLRRNTEAVRQTAIALLRYRDDLPADVVDDHGENLHELGRLAHRTEAGQPAPPAMTALLRLVLATLDAHRPRSGPAELWSIVSHGRELLAQEPRIKAT